MTVASSLAKAGPFLDTGGTSYPFALQTPDAASVKVVRTTKVGDLYSDATLERGVDYNVSLNPDQESSPGGTVETTVSVAGTYITILRDIDATQGTSIPNQGGFYPEVLERALDKLTMLIQQARAEMGRALLLSYADTSTNLEDLVRGVVSAGDAAAQSASQAAGSASAASGSAGAASTSAGSASVAAQLAQDWAAKTGATVDGSEYSAKHYAQLAAASSGLPAQTGQAGKYLSTDGTAAAWVALGSAAAKDVPASGNAAAGEVVIGSDTRLLDEVGTPTNTSPAADTVIDTETPTLMGSGFFSLYEATQDALQVQVSTSPTFGTTVYDSGTLAAGTSHKLPAGKIVVSSNYYWRVRYRNTRGTWSEWSAATGFTTAAAFNYYIPTPTATPANFGDALEGGFYAGMIWGELAQSSTSTAIGTGSKTFTVPDMVASPIVYAGQQLEIRSRANPANKMAGTVTGASGTSLTVNVTSVSGSGVATDWSVMSRYRVIVAPKASGENASVAVKNGSTALPTACQTLNEGLRATQAMKDADTSAVYPAAWWARGLTINGKTDWYVPARDELELCWRNLKPTTTANYTTADRPVAAAYSYANNGAYGDVANTHGTNNNSAPTGAAYTSSVPAQTGAVAFQTGGAEAFEFSTVRYWTSTDYNASSVWDQYWSSSFPGYQSYDDKTTAYRVRAVRRSIL